MSFAPTQTRRPFFRRRKTCPFTGANAPKIDYKDVRLLQRYVSERGKIVPRTVALRDPIVFFRSSPRKRGPRLDQDWIPACAGMSGR
jgi:hypothetical protein